MSGYRVSMSGIPASMSDFLYSMSGFRNSMITQTFFTLKSSLNTAFQVIATDRAVSPKANG